MPSSNLTTSAPIRAQFRNGVLRPVRRDSLKLGAGRQYRVIPGSGKAKASALNVNPSGITRRSRGVASTPISRVCEVYYLAALEDVRPLEMEGLDAACAVDAARHIATAYARYDRMSYDELRGEIRRVVQEETRADAVCDVMQMEQANGDLPEDLGPAIEAGRKHLARVARWVAAMELIEEKRRTGRAS